MGDVMEKNNGTENNEHGNGSNGKHMIGNGSTTPCEEHGVVEGMQAKSNRIENNGHGNGSIGMHMIGTGSTTPCEEHGLLASAAEEEALATCPTCGSMISRASYEKILNLDAARARQVAAERAALDAERKAVGAERDAIVKAVTDAERAKWAAQAEKIARAIEEAKLHAENKQKELMARHKKELEVAVKRRAAHEAQVAKRIGVLEQKAQDEAVRAARDARKEQSQLVESLRKALKTTEERRVRDEAAWKTRVTELQRQTETRDRGHFGIEGEEQLVALLRDEFPGDRVERHGASGDVHHYVIDHGRVVALFLYEVKNTSTFQRSYVRQIAADMEANATRFGFLVSRALPARCGGLCVLSDVLVCSPTLVAQVARIVREGAVEIARMRLSEKGKDAKAQLLIDFCRGDEFTNGMRTISGRIEECQEAMARERSVHETFWSSRSLAFSSVLRAAAQIETRVREVLSASYDEGRSGV